MRRGEGYQATPPHHRNHHLTNTVTKRRLNTLKSDPIPSPGNANPHIPPLLLRRARVCAVHRPFAEPIDFTTPRSLAVAGGGRKLVLLAIMNGGIGDALMQPQHVQVMSSSLPMVASTFVAEPAAAANKPRAAGLPPTPPQVFAAQRAAAAAGGDVCMEESAQGGGGGLPPRKAHRRSSSDVPFGYLAGQHQLLPPKVEAGWGHLGAGAGGAAAADDLFNAYLNLEGLDGLNSSDDRHDEGDSRGSSIKTNGADSSENESEECADDTRGGIRLWSADGGERREGVKRNAAGEPATAPLARHARSLSMDSLIGKFNFTAGTAAAAGNGVALGPNRFSLEFGSGEFTPSEMKKIMADEKLAEMALADPKRVKR